MKFSNLINMIFLLIFLVSCSTTKKAPVSSQELNQQGAKLVKKDPDSSKNYFYLACMKKNARGCTSLGAILQKEGHATEAKRFFQFGCELKDDLACIGLKQTAKNRKMAKKEIRKKVL